LNHRKSQLTAAIVSCLAISFAASAQEAQPDATELDRVVVTGIRASLQQALETKRNADAIVDVITAEDVGKFPATNVAEAMTSITGVTVDRAFGQGERVSILGTDPALNRTLLNGQAIATADWNMSDFPTRTFNYSLLSPQIVGKVEVYKSPEARLEEGSIGGTVIVSTRKPLDLPRNLLIAGQVSYMRNDLVGKTDPQAALMFGWKNEANTFGITASAQKDVENIRRDGIESFNLVRASQFAPSIANGNCVGACAEAITANPNAYGQNSTGAHYFEQERDRKTYTLGLQAKPTDKLELEFNALSIKAGYDHLTHPMYSNQGNAFNSLDKLTDVTIENGIITKGTVKNGLVIFDQQNRLATTKSDTYDFKASWNDEGWFASTQFGSTKASGGPKQVYAEFLARTDYSWDISGAPDQPGKLTFPGANPFKDPSLFTIQGWGGNIVEKPTKDEEKYAQVDFGIKFNSPVYMLRFGYKQREHHTSQIQRGFGINTTLTPSAAEFSPRPLPGNYLNGFSNTGDLGNRFTMDGWKFYDYAMSGAWLPAGSPKPVATPYTALEFAANTWEIDEDIKAAYLQADFSHGRLRGNLGVRFVETAFDSGGLECNTGLGGCTVNGMTSAQQEASYTHIVKHRKYNNTLPNLNLIYDVNDDLVLRFSAAKVMSRPNYVDISSFFWLSDQQMTGSGGNPDLKPYRSTNYDFSAEWYFAPNSILSGSLFYRDVADYILSVTEKEDFFNINQGRVMTYEVSRPRNVGTAKVKGVSLAYQQNFGLGFGLLTNYTLVDSEGHEGRPLPFASRHQVNITPFYEQGNWSARVSYGWRDKYFTRVIGRENTWAMDYASLEASVGYRINEHLQVQLNAMNLLNETYHTYIGNEKVTNGAFKTGRRYQASLRFEF